MIGSKIDAVYIYKKCYMPDRICWDKDSGRSNAWGEGEPETIPELAKAGAYESSLRTAGSNGGSPGS